MNGKFELRMVVFDYGVLGIGDWVIRDSEI
jgi:hypothetical protein